MLTLLVLFFFENYIKRF